VLDQRGIAVGERYPGADAQHARFVADLLEFGHLADVDNVTERTELLGDPHANVGTASEESCLRMGGTQAGELGQRLRRIETLPLVCIHERLAASQGPECFA